MFEPAIESAWRSLLSRGLDELGLLLNEAQQTSLLGFVALLQHWNRAYNLTAVRDPQDMITRHLLDSLSVGRFLVGERVLDVGTGAGLPGIPLAIAQPARQFTLLDGNGKKTRFVQQAAIELALKNVQVERIRIEDFIPRSDFDALIVRAFAPLSDILVKTKKLVHTGGLLVVMKGAYPDTELEAALAASLAFEAVPLRVPGLDAERHVVLVSRSG